MSPQTIALLEQAASRLFTFGEHCFVLRAATERDSTGGVSVGEEAATTDDPIPCFVTVPRTKPVQSVEGGAWGSTADFIVTLPAIQKGAFIDILDTDKLEVSACGSIPSRRFKIIAVRLVDNMIIEAACVADRQND